MGCWNETCAITNLPILSGEECVMSVFTRDPDYEFAMYHDCAVEHHLRRVEGIFEGIYNYYGWLEDIPEPEDVRESYSLVRLCDYPRAFFLKDAWDWAVEYVGEPKYITDLKDRHMHLKYIEESGEKVYLRSEMFPKGINEDRMVDYLKVHLTCRILRKCIYSGTHFSGSQMMDIEPHEGMVEVTNKLIEKHKNKMESL